MCGVLCAATHWWTRLPQRRHVGAESGPRLEAATKVLTTLAVIGVAAVASASNSHRLIVVAALVLCLAGDIALLELVDRFVLGLGAFLLGHIAFLVAFVRDGVHFGPRTIVAGAGGCLVAATVGRRIVKGARRHATALTVPVVLYLLTVVSMAVVGWSTDHRWVWLGVTAFVVSDAVLGWEEFVRRRPLMPVAVMSTYHLAIFALALSV